MVGTGGGPPGGGGGGGGGGGSTPAAVLDAPQYDAFKTDSFNVEQFTSEVGSCTCHEWGASSRAACSLLRRTACARHEPLHGRPPPRPRTARQVLAGSQTTAQAQLQKLKEGTRQLDAALAAEVTAKSPDLFGSVRRMLDTESALADVVLSVESLQGAVRRIRAEVAGPYEHIKSRTHQLRNLHDTIGLLRHLIHRMRLVQKLRALMAAAAQPEALDLAKVARLLTELGAVDKAVSFAGVQAVQADAAFLESTSALVHEQAEVRGGAGRGARTRARRRGGMCARCTRRWRSRASLRVHAGGPGRRHGHHVAGQSGQRAAGVLQPGRAEPGACSCVRERVCGCAHPAAQPPEVPFKQGVAVRPPPLPARSPHVRPRPPAPPPPPGRARPHVPPPAKPGEAGACSSGPEAARRGGRGVGVGPPRRRPRLGQRLVAGQAVGGREGPGRRDHGLHHRRVAPAARGGQEEGGCAHAHGCMLRAAVGSGRARGRGDRWRLPCAGLAVLCLRARSAGALHCARACLLVVCWWAGGCTVSSAAHTRPCAQDPLSHVCFLDALVAPDQPLLCQQFW